MDKSLSIALLISALFHTTVFLPLAQTKEVRVEKDLPPLKITYLRPEKASSKKVTLAKKSAVEVKQNAIAKTASRQRTTNSIVQVEKKLAKKQNLKIEIPPELPKEKEALYLDYYRSIREKIRELVLENYPRYVACGEVRLYFILSSDGRLKQIKILQERSSPNRILKEVASKSVRQAAPFLPFPKELNQAQLSFNVVISFELEN
ncbi:MAG: TonB family protein [Omnitrophica bacterium]|nr:TonB family protein [Candidatus Omnitrophota bacterium]